mmetsp:Transcript_64087/g.166534  ORF Transcript_64087/g.166534 Transcript_64087/m.166534 type:complete len:213 (+) Transcript_64087:127-765(+)
MSLDNVVVWLHHQALAVVIPPECSSINEHREYSTTLPAIDQVLHRDDARGSRLHHIKDLVLDIVNRRNFDFLGLQQTHNRPEEVVYDETIKASPVVDVNQFPEILNGLSRILVLHCKNEIEERLVVHLTFPSLSIPVGLVLLENSVYEYISQHAATIMAQLVLAEHSVLVHVKLEVGTVDLKRRLHAEPIGLSLRCTERLLLPQLVQLNDNL